jgi:hypothetical protein
VNPHWWITPLVAFVVAGFTTGAFYRWTFGLGKMIIRWHVRREFRRADERRNR